MNSHKLIVFDWNGTILADTKASWLAANECLKFFGRPPITLAQYRQTVHFPVIHFYKLNGCDVDTVIAKKEEANSVFYDAYLKHSKGARTRSGVRDLLNWLQDQGYTCTILSNYMTEAIKIELKRLKLEKYFAHICGHDDGHKILTHTSKMQRLSDFMIKRGFKAGNTFIIGDSTEEPEIAHHLGLTCISVGGGYFAENRIRKMNPHFMVSDMGMVKDIIRLQKY